MSIESNVFPFLNLAELETCYRLYEIRGLKRGSEYYQNRQNLIHRLSYLLKQPVTIIERDNKSYLVVASDAPEPPEKILIIRGRVVYFQLTEKSLTLDYLLRETQNDEICLRFLHFMVQSSLFENAKLWQPSAGKAFFDKSPLQEFGSISLFQGFSVRPTFTKNGGIGICVDLKHKFINKNPLPTYLTEQEFQKYKAKHCVYHFGHKWYEIQLSELSELSVTEATIPDGDRKFVSLLDYTIEHSRKPIPKDLASVAQDGAVIHYFNNQSDDRMAIAQLCHLVRDSSDPDIQKYHRHTVLKPDNRRSGIMKTVEKYLSEIKFGKVTLKVAKLPESINQNIFIMPDYSFGNDFRLSVRGTSGATQVSLDRVGKTRAELLSHPNAGFLIQQKFDRQYLLLPQTVGDSFGSKFVEDLKVAVNKLYPAGGGYKPQVIYYPDRGFGSYVEQGKAILQTVEDNQLKPGYCVVMLHRTRSRIKNQHDLLAALVVKELMKKYELYAATIHSTMGQDCYASNYNKQGQPFYSVSDFQRGKLQGYLRAVALNKVLLTNERWPFGLATPSHADITIGIDVKHHTAGYIVINKNGNRIWTLAPIMSRQKEQLSTAQVRECLIEILNKEVDRNNEPILSIVIHRDGRMYECEIEGAKQAIETLKSQGVLLKDATLTILEISKSAPASLRLFDLKDRSGEVSGVENPQIGCYHILGKDGYICSTGKPFLKQGTVQPLHVRYIEGVLSFEQCLEDIYFLTCLTWTKPDDCSRYPITTKINDRRLSEDASEYDEDKLQFNSFDDLDSEVNLDDDSNIDINTTEIKI
jgi:hypothetical protein